MQTFREIRSAHLDRPSVLTVGNFDGVHRGHHALLARVRDLAREVDAESGLVTFDPHPLTVVRPGHSQSLLTTPAERLHLAAQIGLTVGVIQPFTAEIAALGPAVFMGWLKTHLNLAALVVGPDFALGRNRAGDVQVLAALGEEIGYRLIIMEPVDWQGKTVRSSAIRALLDAGQVAEAAELLGRPYHATGVVVHGDHRGRTIGIPTANLEIPPDKHWPANGVYATRATIHGRAGSFPSVTNLGVRPTVDGSVRRCETHLLDFPPTGEDGDLYGKTLTVEFLARLRGEERFSGLPALVAQIHRDIAQARELLAAPALPTGADAATVPFFLAPG